MIINKVSIYQNGSININLSTSDIVRINKQNVCFDRDVDSPTKNKLFLNHPSKNIEISDQAFIWEVLELLFFFENGKYRDAACELMKTCNDPFESFKRNKILKFKHTL